MKNTEWNGIIELVVEVKYSISILIPNLLDLVAIYYLYRGFDA